VLGVNDCCRMGSASSGTAAALVQRSPLVAWYWWARPTTGVCGAFDAKTGKEIWAAMLEANANANPMSYQGRSGKQYVAVVAGNALVVYSL
jgi:glucose dehydrogenase